MQNFDLFTAPARSGLVAPGLLQPVVVEIIFAGIAERNLCLPLVDALSGPVAVAIAVSTNVLRAIRVAATLATRIECVRAIVPAAQPLFVIAPLSLFSTLDFSGLCGFLFELVAIGSTAKPAYRRLYIAVMGTEVAATDDALGRRGTEANCNRTLAAKGHIASNFPFLLTGSHVHI